MGILFSSTSQWSSTGRNILITGASSGIGKCLALQYAATGANLALVARRDMQDLVAQCEASGAGMVRVFHCDLTDGSEIKSAMKQAIQSFTKFDVVILNAGRSQGNYFEELTDMDQVDYLLKLNVNAVIHCCHYLLPVIPKTPDSRIVVISSSAGIVPVPFRTIYCASKHALSGFTNSLRIELGDTYKSSSPAICLINFPEVSGTALNVSRMDFGSKTEPYQFDNNKAIPVEIACRNLLKQIAKGTREWGHPLKLALLRPLLSIIPAISDSLILNTVRKNQLQKAKST